MGRRRKLIELEQTIAVDEDKTSNASSETELGVKKLHSHAKNSNSVEAVNVKNHVQQICNGVKHDKNSRLGSLAVRRSNRIKSLAVRRSNRIKSLARTDCIEVEPVVKHVSFVEDEKEQEPEIQQVPPEVNGRNLEEKVDYLVRTVDEFKSKTFSRQEEGQEISYKSLYINSQKKIESLMEENFNLVRKLEFARGKIAAYEVMKNVVGAPKEVLLVSAVGQAAEIAASLSPQAAGKCSPPPADDPKPKKMYKKQATPHGADDPKPKKTYKKPERR